MFRIGEIVRRGWFNSRVRIVAEAAMTYDDRRLGYQGYGEKGWLTVWHLSVQQGETFEISLPNDIARRTGGLLSLAAVARDPAFEDRRRKVLDF